MATKQAFQEQLNPYEIAKQQFNRAADYLELEPSMRRVLENAKRQLIVSIPVKMDGGDVQVFDGYRVQHNIARGPAKGGIRLAGTKEIHPDDIIGVDCDILLPSALENAITLGTVGTVRAKIIAELANGPTTPGADRVLEDQGVFLVPDILANAGGVTVSYYECVQDQYSFFWSESKINETLETTIRTAFNSVHGTAEKFGTDMRTGAYILAVGRVVEATSVRGIFL